MAVSTWFPQRSIVSLQCLLYLYLGAGLLFGLLLTSISGSLGRRSSRIWIVCRPFRVQFVGDVNRGCQLNFNGAPNEWAAKCLWDAMRYEEEARCLADFWRGRRIPKVLGLVSVNKLKKREVEGAGFGLAYAVFIHLYISLGSRRNLNIIYVQSSLFSVGRRLFPKSGSGSGLGSDRIGSLPFPRKWEWKWKWKWRTIHPSKRLSLAALSPQRLSSRCSASSAPSSSRHRLFCARCPLSTIANSMPILVPLATIIAIVYFAATYIYQAVQLGWIRGKNK